MKELLDNTGWPIIIGARVRVQARDWNGIKVAAYSGTVEQIKESGKEKILRLTTKHGFSYALPKNVKVVRSGKRVKK